MGGVEARPLVFATRALPGPALERLRDRVELRVWPGADPPSAQELREAAREAVGLLCLLSDRIDAQLMAGCPRLRVISSCSVGLDHIDLTASDLGRSRRAELSHHVARRISDPFWILPIDIVAP